jgi:hypothetical protein
MKKAAFKMSFMREDIAPGPAELNANDTLNPNRLIFQVIASRTSSENPNQSNPPVNEKKWSRGNY